MAARWVQKTWPFLDDSILTVKANGKVLTDWYEWCLAVIDATCNVPPFAASAWDAWLVNDSKHEVGGMDIPIGFYVPVFYKGGKYGHVVMVYRESYDKITVWSSPYTHKPYFDVFSGPVVETLDKVGRIYGVQYVGWTEKLGSKQIIQWENVGPDLTFKAFDEPVGYLAKLQPTHLWDVSNAINFDQVKDLRTIDKGTAFWAWGSVFNKQLGQTYLVDKECLEKKIAKGYNIGDMELAPKEVAEPEPTPEPVESEPVVENPTEVETPEPAVVADDCEKVTKEDFEKALERNIEYMEKVSEIINEAGQGITFSAKTKKIVYVACDLLLLAGAEVTPIMTMINTPNDPTTFGSALTQALFIAGLGGLMTFKLLKAKGDKNITPEA